MHCPLSWWSGSFSEKLCRTYILYGWKACIWGLSWTILQGTSNSLNLWQVDLFGLAMIFSFTLLEVDDSSQKSLADMLSVSLNFWTSFPAVLWEMAALSKWYALKGSAIHSYYQPFHPLGSISSINSFFITLEKTWNYNICVSKFYGHPVYIGESSENFLFHPNDKSMSWLLLFHFVEVHMEAEGN